MCIIVYCRAGEVVGVIICDMYELHLPMYQSRVTGVDRRDDATFGIALTLDPRHGGIKPLTVRQHHSFAISYSKNILNSK
jgi:hypothetical protein